MTAQKLNQPLFDSAPNTLQNTPPNTPSIIPRWYDSAAQALLPLTVPKGEMVNIYACGITPYSASHIGHARSFVVFDAFAKSLRALGWPANLVRNITDIDDKIIQAAKDQNTTWDVLSNHFAGLNRQLFEKLGVSQTVEPKVSEFIPEIQSFIQNLIDKGHAYQTPLGNVYFAVASFNPTDLMHQHASSLKTASGEGRVNLEDKRAPEDFALWKHADHAPHWESPWGSGRPGWHIECSAMIEATFKGPIHIHGGGIDLRFPHHQCEAHQSEAYLGKPLANHWVHHGSVLREGQKMSKSIGNVIGAQELLDEAEALLPGRGGVVVRFALLSTHWQKPLDWSDRVLPRAVKAVSLLEKAIQTQLQKESVNQVNINQIKKDKKDVFDSMDDSVELKPFFEALADNFNTPTALGWLVSYGKNLGKDPIQNISQISASDLNQDPVFNSKSPQIFNLAALQEGLKSLGFDEVLWPWAFVLQTPIIQNIPSAVLELFEQRENARKTHDFKTSDLLRAQLNELGWQVEDQKEQSRLKPKF